MWSCGNQYLHLSRTKIRVILTTTLLHQRFDRMMKKERITLYTHEHPRNAYTMVYRLRQWCAEPSGKTGQSCDAQWHALPYQARPKPLFASGGRCVRPSNDTGIHG